jgi:hypothetical protein
MQNKPFFPNLRKVKGVITPEGEALTLKRCEGCDGEFLGNKLQTKCAACRITRKKKSKTKP